MPKFEIIRDPAALAERLQAATRPRALALDLATSTGYACAEFDPSLPITVDRLMPTLVMGQLDLSAGQYDSGAIRFVKLRQFLDAAKPSIIFYEQIRDTPPMAGTRAMMAAIVARVYTAAKLAGAFIGTVCCWAEERNIPCVGLEIGQIKKRATGKGNAGKPAMIEACNAMFGTELEVDGFETSGCDNIADAAHILLLGLETYGKGYADDDRTEQ